MLQAFFITVVVNPTTGFCSPRSMLWDFLARLFAVSFSISVQACSILDLLSEDFIALIAPNLIFSSFTCTGTLNAHAEIANVTLKYFRTAVLKLWVATNW